MWEAQNYLFSLEQLYNAACSGSQPYSYFSKIVLRNHSLHFKNNYMSTGLKTHQIVSTMFKFEKIV